MPSNRSGEEGTMCRKGSTPVEEMAKDRSEQLTRLEFLAGELLHAVRWYQLTFYIYVHSSLLRHIIKILKKLDNVGENRSNREICSESFVDYPIGLLKQSFTHQQHCHHGWHSRFACM